MLYKFKNGIPFCLELKFILGATKASYSLWLGEHDGVKFELRENTIVGKAEYRDGFPLKYEIHPSMKLSDKQKFFCEKLVHRAIVGMLPKTFLKMGFGNIEFSPTFPSYVLDGGPLVSDEDKIFNRG